MKNTINKIGFILCVALLSASSIIYSPHANAQINPPGDAQIWGGDDIVLRVQGNTANIQFTCAAGNITKWIPYAPGQIAGVGTYTQHTGANPGPDVPPILPVPASFQAVITGNKMVLRMFIRYKMPQVFKLVRGVNKNIPMCM